MKIVHILLLSIVFLGFKPAFALSDLSGRILLEVEKNGEAWYFEPVTGEFLYLGRPADAFSIMRSKALGISNEDFIKLEKDGAAKFAGRILLKVEDLGRAFYVNPVDAKMHYLGRPADAFRVMRELGLGVSNIDFARLQAGGSENSAIKSVPFTSQAPFGDWSNQRFQDGCEEASVLMAMKWVQGEKLDSEMAEKEILALSYFAEEKYGEYRDQSVADTARLISDYYSYNNYEVRTGTVADIIDFVNDGKLVILPFNGQKLNNPYFTTPGPINHMALIYAYDVINDEFILNDPGTRHGENFRYKKNVVDSAWREYKTGYHEPVDKIIKKMIVIW